MTKSWEYCLDDVLSPERVAYLREPSPECPGTRRIDWVSGTSLQLEVMAVLIRRMGELTAALKKS